MKTEPNQNVHPTGDHNNIEPAAGISLRQHFAVMAMQGLLHNYYVNGMYGNSCAYPMVEEAAVRCADALIEELNKSKHE